MGRHKNIDSPEAMWAHFQTYTESIKRYPIKVHDFVGKDATEVRRERERPLTMEGFQNYLEMEEIITDVSDYFENKEGRYEEYIRICSRIRRLIRQDQIEGGMAGIYNPSITQRLNGLSEKTENRLTDKDGNDRDVADYSNLTPDELNSLIQLQRKACGK
ncbi:MAG: terminase small subunit [Agriterribacter sp.]